MTAGVEDRRSRPRGTDRRRKPRQTSFLGGQITFRNGLIRIECLVRNVAGRGAKLVLAQEEAIPDEFDLAMAGRPGALRARVVWRRGKELGVKLSPMPVTTSPVRLEKRVRELEAENAALKRALRP